MEVTLEKAKDYIMALKEAGNFSSEDMANISGIPIQTIRNICSGKHEAKFGTVAKLVIALGGDLNELIGYEKKKEIEVNSTVSLKETYEMRIADLIKSCDSRIEDMIKSCDSRIEDIKALCELRVEDIQKFYDARIDDMKRNFEERLIEQREMLLSAKV